MSRSGYSDDCDGWELIRWRGAVNSAINGKRGQKLLRELADAMDAMPEKILIASSLANASGQFCALGVVGSARGIRGLLEIDPEDSQKVSSVFDIAEALAKEIVYINDEVAGYLPEKSHERWRIVRNWVEENLI